VGPRQIRVAASKAAVAFIQVAVTDLQRRKAYADVLQAILQAIVAMLENDDEETARVVLQELIELANTSALVFRPYCEPVVSIAATIMENVNADNGKARCAVMPLRHSDTQVGHHVSDTRQLALELLLVLAERKPTMMRNTPTFVQRTLRAILMLMTDITDEAAWHNSDMVR
jgi:hypothetical protein